MCLFVCLLLLLFFVFFCVFFEAVEGPDVVVLAGNAAAVLEWQFC